MKDGNKILIVGLAAYFLFMRKSQASNENGNAGGSSNGGAGGSSNGGAGGSSNGGAFPGLNLPGLGGNTGGQSPPPFSPSRAVVTADGRTVYVVEQECPSASNPFVGTIIDQQSGREVGVCAGDPRIDDPTYQPYETPLNLVLA